MNKGVFLMKKQTWKSIFLSLIAIFTLFLLGACGQQSVQKSYLQKINQDGKVDIRVTFEHKGDKTIVTKPLILFTTKKLELQKIN